VESLKAKVATKVNTRKMAVDAIVQQPVAQQHPFTCIVSRKLNRRHDCCPLNCRRYSLDEEKSTSTISKGATAPGDTFCSHAL
jgi:hypothetical protein